MTTPKQSNPRPLYDKGKGKAPENTGAVTKTEEPVITTSSPPENPRDIPGLDGQRP